MNTTEKPTNETDHKNGIQYKELVEKANIGIGIDDVDGNLIYWNNHFLKLFGYSPEEIKHKTHRDLIHPDDLEMVLRYHRNRLNGKKAPSRYEFRGIRKDGSTLYIEIDICEIIRKNKEFSGTRSYLWDISKQKKAELALMESKQQMALHMDNSPLAIIEWDNQSRISRWSREAENIFGWTKKEALGKNAEELQMIYEEDKSMVQKFVGQLTDGVSRQVSNTNRNYTKDKKIIYCEWYNSVLYDPQGHIKSAMSQVLDITKRKQAELESHKSKERFRQLFDNLGETVFVTSVGEENSGKILEVNHAASVQTGYTKKELLQMNINTDLRIIGTGSINTRDWNEKLLRGEQVTTIEKKRKKDGTEYWAEVTVAPFEFQGQKASLSINHDITERMLADKALRQSEESYRDLFNNASDAIYIQDKEGRFIIVNQGAVDMYGYPAEYFIGKTPGFLSAPGKNDLDRVAQLVEEAYNGKPQKFEFWGLRKNGEVFPKIVRSQPGIFHGKPVSITFALDITEQKRAEQEIIKKNEILAFINELNSVANKGVALPLIIKLITDNIQGLFDCYGASVFLLNDKNNQLTMQNIALPVSVIKSLEKFISSKLPRVVLPAQAMSFFNKTFDTMKVLNVSEPGEIKNIVLEFRHMLQTDKKLIDSYVQKILKAISGILKIKGLMYAPLGTFQDRIGVVALAKNTEFSNDDAILFDKLGRQITSILHRYYAMGKIRESEERFHLIFNTGTDGIITANPENCQILDFNEQVCSMLDYTKKEFKNLSFDRIEAGEDFQKIKDNCDRIIKTGRGTFETKYCKKDGTMIDVEVSASAFEHRGQHLVLSFIRNISQRKRAEEELAKYREHLEELVKERTAELEEKNAELEHFNQLFVGREFRIKELRDKVKELGKQINE